MNNSRVMGGQNKKNSGATEIMSDFGKFINGSSSGMKPSSGKGQSQVRGAGAMQYYNDEIIVGLTPSNKRASKQHE